MTAICETPVAGVEFEEKSSVPFTAGAPLLAELFARVRRTAMLEHCKWDPQVGDTATLADFPLLMPRDTWKELAQTAEALCAESMAAENELLHRPEVLERIGWPRKLRKTLARCVDAGCTPGAARTMRFDFHFTTEGWRISEVNSDVPGGFTEAASFTQLIANHYSDAAPAGNPVAAWTESLLRSAGNKGTIALLTAPGFMEDHQIMAYLARHLHERGCQSLLAAPRQLRWRDGEAHLRSSSCEGRVDAVVRFYQSEWLAKLPRGCGWTNLFHGAKTPVANPGYAVVLENKRFPLVWDELNTPLPTWRKLLPETRDPREAPWQTDESWLVKTPLCNTGDTISIRSLLSENRWQQVTQRVRRHPDEWVAQRRFQTVPLATPAGAMHPCLGVYTVDGKASGCYARLSRGPVVDIAAVDVALLLAQKGEPA